MNKPELLRTGEYSIIMDNEMLRINDLRISDFRYAPKESLSLLMNLTSEEIDDWCIELFRV